MEIIPIKDIRKIYQPYDGVWDEWKASPECFLDRKSIILFENYLKSGSLNSSCRKFHIDIEEAHRILNTTVILLHYRYPLFEQWLLKKFYKHSVFWLINVPLQKLPLPTDFKPLLKMYAEKNLKELFKKYSLKDFSLKWGKEKAVEFYGLMEHYQCAHLIKKNKSKRNAK